MKNNLKTFSLFIKPDEKSEKIAEQIRQINFHSKKPLQEKENGDLILAVGGDGTFLRAVNKTNFSKSSVYVGIHTGTLGFLQDLSESDIYSLIQYLSFEEKIRTRRVPVPTVTVNLLNSEIQVFKVFNEVQICGKDYTKIRFSEYIGREHLQDVSGNGIIISSSTGDTAYSRSAGGAIVFADKPLLVCTLLTPIKNGAYEDYLPNSVICSNATIKLKPASNIQIITDGQIQQIQSEQIKSVEVSMLEDSYVNKLEIKDYSKVGVVRNKILGYNR